MVTMEWNTAQLHYQVSFQMKEQDAELWIFLYPDYEMDPMVSL